ncbi:hypothetical protein D9611_008794 [Ephemerocybe angulata]|uniref:F-box domain-containing protein n=1 Tax=Ephemerocybe angulata TaxID=980116 RepID=A0A8H5FJH4_9AGAR|nr:hypothetical protein D9611_008794 [Tulosesus angulatus]
MFSSNNLKAWKETFIPTPASKATLDEGVLPADLWFEIAIIVEPRDLLAMKLVCKALHEMFADRELWKYVLHDVCHRHSIFLPSYPIDDMSLTELQRAALGPYRWARLLKRKANPSIRTESTRLLKPLKENNHPLGVAPNSLQFLVPGGRFLFIAQRHSLDLWDLGVVGRQPLEASTLIARVHTAPPSRASALGLDGLAVIPLDDTTLRVAVALTGKNSLFNVYDICPIEQDAKFQSVGSIAVHTEVEEKPVCKNLLIHGNRLHVSLTKLDISFIWDFSTGRYTTGRPRMSNFNSDISQKVFTGTSVIEFGKDSLLAWAIPFSDADTASATDGFAYLDADFPRVTGEKHEVLYPTWRAISIAMTTVHIPSLWHHGPVLPITFDIIRETWAHKPSDDGATGFRYRVDVKPDPSDPLNSHKMGVAFKLLAKFELPAGFCYTPLMEATPNAGLGARHASAPIMRMAQPCRVVEDVSSEVLYSLYSVTSHRAIPEVRLTPILKSADGVRVVSPSLCSASGRLVHTMYMNGVPAFTRVSDYLSPWKD